MSGDDVLIVAMFLVALALPIWLTGRLWRWLLRRREDLVMRLEERGSVHGSLPPLMMGIILFGAGAVLQGAALIPLVVWIVDGDPEARRVALTSIVVFAFFAACGAAVAWPGLRLWIVEPRALVAHRLGRERRLDLADVTAVREVRRLVGGLEVVTPSERWRISQVVEGYDLLLDRLVAGVPAVDRVAAAEPSRRGPTTDVAARAAEARPTVWRVPPWRIRTMLGGLGALLVFLVAWPWGVIEAENVVADSLKFVAVGLVIWGLVALAVLAENLPKGQPTAIRVADGVLHVDVLRGTSRSVPVTDVVSVSVVPDIIYVKGFPGARYPVWILLADGERLEISDVRARQMDVSTQVLAADLRHAVQDVGAGHHDPDASDRHLGDLERARDAGDWPTAASALAGAIAAYPASHLLDRYAELAELFRRAEQLEHAVATHVAHLDRHPDDADAWQGLAAAQLARGREDLAQQATTTAERLLLH